MIASTREYFGPELMRLKLQLLNMDIVVTGQCAVGVSIEHLLCIMTRFLRGIWRAKNMDMV